MKKVAIVGNIASGKSEVEKIIKKLGYKTICADETVHELYNLEEVRAKIFNIFNTVNRKEISNIVFSDKLKKKQLEDILHPLVIKKIDEFFRVNSRENLVFAVVPLLFEANLKNMFDFIIFVSLKEDLRLKRVIKRDKCTEIEAYAKINAQDSEKSKIALSDIIIENNSDIKNLQLKTKEAISELE